MTWMFTIRPKRQGFSLIELLVSIAIISIVLALLMSAIMKLRASAALLETKNKLKQMSLAYFQVDEKNVVAKGAVKMDMMYKNEDPTLGGGAVFKSLLPYLELANGNGEPINDPVKFFLSSNDPSMQLIQGMNVVYPRGVGHDNDPVIVLGTTSFCVNSYFCYECRKLRDISDGSSNTILFSERFANCGVFHVFWDNTGSICIFEGPPRVRTPCWKMDRRATFADKLYPDYVPTWDQQQQRTIGISRTPASVRNQPFQVAPSLKQCDLNLAQSHTTAGLCVAMADGSVRVIAPNVEPSIYWSMVTPRGGETINVE